MFHEKKKKEKKRQSCSLQETYDGAEGEKNRQTGCKYMREKQIKDLSGVYRMSL